MEKTAFISISKDERQTLIAGAIVAREREIMDYELNIENFEAMLKMPDISPAFAKQLSDRLITENAEREKAVAIYNALKLQIPKDELAAAVMAAKT